MRLADADILTNYTVTDNGPKDKDSAADCASCGDRVLSPGLGSSELTRVLNMARYLPRRIELCGVCFRRLYSQHAGGH